MMKIVLFGKNGQVGWELHRILPSLGQVVALDYKDLDLADLKAVQTRLEELRPDLIVNASAYTAVDQAEVEREVAMKVNGEAPGVMAEAARRFGGMLVHYSTDYVFDGKKGSAYIETDIPNPINVYGESKLAGENAVQQAAGAYLILRTSWVYSTRMQSGFVRKVLAWARQNETLGIVDDQIGSPTWARMLAETTALLLAKADDRPVDYFQPNQGIYHVAGKGSASRYEWAQAILASDPRRDEQKASHLEPAKSAEFPTAATRPEYSVLDCTHFENTFGLRIPDWRKSLVLAMGE
jgi:dTDP-4-dehydrorhamnose reductase